MTHENFRQVYQIRYDECDPGGALTTAYLLRYLQDIAGLDAGRIYDDKGGIWLTKRTVITFPGPVPARAALEVRGANTCGFAVIVTEEPSLRIDAHSGPRALYL